MARIIQTSRLFAYLQEATRTQDGWRVDKNTQTFILPTISSNDSKDMWDYYARAVHYTRRVLNVTPHAGQRLVVDMHPTYGSKIPAHFHATKLMIHIAGADVVLPQQRATESWLAAANYFAYGNIEQAKSHLLDAVGDGFYTQDDVYLALQLGFRVGIKERNVEILTTPARRLQYRVSGAIEAYPIPPNWKPYNWHILG